MTYTQTILDDVIDLDPGAFGKRGELGLAAAHYLDVIRRNARRRLDDGEHPDDVMDDLYDAIGDWLIARDHRRFETLGRNAQFIHGIEQEVRGLIGAASTSAWFVCPNPMLGGRTPVQELLNHRFGEIRHAVRRLQPWHRPWAGHFGPRPMDPEKAREAAMTYFNEREADEIAPAADGDDEQADGASNAGDGPQEARRSSLLKPEFRAELRQAFTDLGLDPDKVLDEDVGSDDTKDE